MSQHSILKHYGIYCWHALTARSLCAFFAVVGPLLSVLWWNTGRKVDDADSVSPFRSPRHPPVGGVGRPPHSQVFFG